jgi:hypothetical protein
MEFTSCRDFGLRSFEVLEFLVLKIRDLPNPDMPMALSLSELFPSPRIYATRPGEMDGPDSPRDIATCDAPLTQLSVNLKPRMPIR